MGKMKNRLKTQWNEVYKNEKRPKPIQEDFPDVVKVFKEHNVNRVLDLACGSGRHLVYLASEGFSVYGLDISKEGITKAQAALKEKHLKADLVVGSMYQRLPYETDFFDAIICIRALHHGTIEEISRAIKEMERVLKPKGLIYVTVRKRIPKREMLPHKYIAPRTYVPTEGKEKGVVHYLFNKKLLEKKFKNFKILRLKADHGPKKWEAYYSLLGELKQNSKK